MSEKKKNKKTKKEFQRPASLMAVQAKLGLFKGNKDNKKKEAHDFLKKPPLGFLQDPLCIYPFIRLEGIFLTQEDYKDTENKQNNYSTGDLQ